MSSFKSMLLDISNELSASQLEAIKFLCHPKLITKKDLERIGSGTVLFQILTERGHLGPDNTECLSGLLSEIKRPDLSDRLKGYSESGSTGSQPEKEERDKLDVATDVIAENLGGDWRKLGRKLGLSEVKLESISNRHPTDLEETVRELLKEWRKSRGAEARAEDLIVALRSCQFNLMADNVKERLQIP